MTKFYTAEQLKKKYRGMYINVYLHHYEQKDEKTGKYITVYEVRGISKVIRENYNLPEDCIIE
jgi:hypothetical protein